MPDSESPELSAPLRATPPEPRPGESTEPIAHPAQDPEPVKEPAQDPEPEPAPIAAVPDAPLRLITRDEVQAAQDIRFIVVPVDEWKKGASVRVRTPTAADRDLLEFVMLAGDKKLSKQEIRAHFVALCCVDANNVRVFEPEDVLWLREKNAIPMDRIFTAILKSAIITEADIDDLAKNSGAASGTT